MTKELLLSALRQAYFRRKPGRGVVFHSDRGSQYCSREFRDTLNRYQMIQSHPGDCWDNACVESFFHTLKTEMIYHEDLISREEAHRAIFDWIEVFYHRQRLHSTLGYKTPVAFERMVQRKSCLLTVRFWRGRSLPTINIP